jgi:hypothetical protein
MQTFLPNKDFRTTALILDNRRLWKQIIEGNQILNILEPNLITTDSNIKILGSRNQSTRAWRNHPAVLMWRGYNEALKSYINECIKEWRNRGFNNWSYKEFKINDIKEPKWFIDDRVFKSHRIALLCKKYDYYSKFDWIENKEINKLKTYTYFWPTKNGY